MIANIIIVLLLIILIPDVFLYWRFLRRKSLGVILLWFLPGLLLMAATICYAFEKDFVPDDMERFGCYLLLMGLLPISKLLFSIATLFGKQGWKAGTVLVVVVWLTLFYGAFVEPAQIEVRQVEISFKDLPKAFDGYRIVQFSDLHLGSTNELFVNRLVDSINEQHPDVVVFTGDIQNKKPSEVEPYKPILSAIVAPDGVLSVQGNHDYAMYVDAPYYEKAMNEEETIGEEQEMGWKVLANHHQKIYRDADSIVIAGMENDGEGRFPQKGSLNNALCGLSRDQFVVMLEHDPSSWRRKILTHSHAQLTLSGHTHGMQFRLFGWSPLGIFKKETDGLYERESRYLFVSKGAGALVPFRLGCKPEIVVITLKTHNP